MPIYVYRYTDTDEIETFEILQQMKDDPFITCPESGRPVERIIQSPSIIMDSNKPKTLGSLAQKNTEEAIKRGQMAAPKTQENPWWRPNKKKPVDMTGKSQKQVERYIREGKL